MARPKKARKARTKCWNLPVDSSPAMRAKAERFPEMRPAGIWRAPPLLRMTPHLHQFPDTFVNGDILLLG
jgi:hypothetical protein